MQGQVFDIESWAVWPVIRLDRLVLVQWMPRRWSWRTRLCAIAIPTVIMS